MTNYYNKDLYKILDVNFDASIEEIKSAYRKLARIYHPDVAKLRKMPIDLKKFMKHTKY